MKIYAHRGYSSKYLENTRKSFEACKNLNIEGTELDVQYSKDKKVVVFHDENIKRLTGIDGFLKDYSYEELSNFTFKDGQTFLLLEDYVDIVKDTKLITNVELKTGKFEYLGIEQDVYDIFKKKNMLDRLLISSFNFESLVRFQQIDPNIPLAALFSKVGKTDFNYLQKHNIKIYHPKYLNMQTKDIKAFHKDGIKVNVWTVNDKLSYLRCKFWGVEGIITNYPEI